jgi:predicted ATPase
MAWGKVILLGFLSLLKNIYDEEKIKNYVNQEGGADNLLYRGLKISDYLCGKLEFINNQSYRFRLQPTLEGNLYTATRLMLDTACN